MNADRTDTRDPHLDLDDLIAGAAGQPVGDQARAHLTRCQECRREANRWHLVAGGIGGLAVAAQPAAQPAAPPAPPRSAGRRGRPGPWRRALLVAGSAAAAFVLLVGAGELAGVVHIRLGQGGTSSVLTAVSGCSQLQQADGTLEGVHGGHLIVKTASGQPVTVTTTAATIVSASGNLLGDITDGASVRVHGSRSGGTIRAALVTVGPSSTMVNPKGSAPVQGTVADASRTGFILVTSGGTRVPVTTSGDTLVVVTHARLAQLPVGAAVFALGLAGADGTLAARAVAAVAQLPSGGHISVSVKDCSSGSIAEAMGAISAAGSAG